MDEPTTWKIIDSYFRDNPDFLVKHHLTSFNAFMFNNIPQIMREYNPSILNQEQNDMLIKCEMYYGGKNGDRIYYGKPVIYDADRMHYMYPNEARLRNMTYGVSIHYDVEVVITFEQKNTKKVMNTETVLLESLYLGRFPIMLKSKLCVLNQLDKNVCFNMGECINDPGGYFIIDGNEKVIISQEKFAPNMLNIKNTPNDIYKCVANLYSKSEDESKSVRNLSVCLVNDEKQLTNNQIIVNIPNVKKGIPLFILMRALGVISDKQIASFCLLDLEANSNLLPLLIPSVHDAGCVFTQNTAILYIASFIKVTTPINTMNILSNYLLPHIGTDNFIEKAYFIGYMVNRMLKVYTKMEPETDRDSYKFKRIELSGTLLTDLFKEYYILQQKHTRTKIESEYIFNSSIYEGMNIKNLFLNKFFEERIVEDGFMKAFKGNWGGHSYTKRIGVVQELPRLSFNAFISSLRKTNLPINDSAKVIGPHMLHSSQWGLMDPIDTPDGPNAGIHKNLCMTTVISDGYSKKKIIELLKEFKLFILLTERNPVELFQSIKIIINGDWCGVTDEPVVLVDKLRTYRRCGLIPPLTSISWKINEKTIYIYTDSGRPMRPIFYLDKGHIVNKDKLKSDFTWSQLMSGFSDKPKKFDHSIHRSDFYKLSDLYSNDDEMLNHKSTIEYLDTSETDTCMISFDKEESSYTHREIHGSLLLGVMGNQIIFPENNQLPRDLFSCGQGKQAVSLFHTNYQNRIDTMGVVLNNGQIPLIKSRYMKYINQEKNPYGVNVIVAIMCYSGYNVEDAIIFNQAAIDRGLFNTSYYSCYETRESIGTNDITEISNINNKVVMKLRAGYDYSQLDERGLIKENTPISNDKITLIGMTTRNKNTEGYIDNSVFTSKGQEGYVDKSFITEGEGVRIAKIRIREERRPEIGDKFVSRAGQKGTCGVILKEVDMPYTSNGIRPDIIINPHALPSRMTIGQLIESLLGKIHLEYGGFGDCTAFNNKINKGLKNNSYTKILTKIGYHHSGNELLYNGMTGTQIESDIFIGPTYYLRLKHMVKDKINYRQRGPTTIMTRQPVQGRSNDGGLRIGEMERDGLISHGMNKFIKDSMMERADKYMIAIDNVSGLIAAYNPSKNIFLSPMLDGPLQYNFPVDDNPSIINVTKHKKTFSVIKIPYAFKQLYYELLTMNIQMRIITDDNIDSIQSLSYSNNIKQLMNKPNEHISNVIQDIIKQAKSITPYVKKAKKEFHVKEEKQDEIHHFTLGDMVKFDNMLWEIKEINGKMVTLENDDGTQIKTNIKNIVLHYVSLQIPPYIEFDLNNIVYFKNNLEQKYKVTNVVNHFNVDLIELNTDYPTQLHNIRMRRLNLYEPLLINDTVYIRDDIMMKPWIIHKIHDNTTVQIRDDKSKIVNVTIDKITKQKLYTKGEYKHIQEKALQQRIDKNIYVYDRVRIKENKDIWVVDSIELHRDMNVYNLVNEKTFKTSSALITDLELVESCKFPKHSKVYLASDKSSNPTKWTVKQYYAKQYKNGMYSIIDNDMHEKDVYAKDMIMVEMPENSLRGGGYIKTTKIEPVNKMDLLMMESFHHGGNGETVVTEQKEEKEPILGDFTHIINTDGMIPLTTPLDVQDGDMNDCDIIVNIDEMNEQNKQDLEKSMFKNVSFKLDDKLVIPETKESGKKIII